jgi:hypothetical protein
MEAAAQSGSSDWGFSLSLTLRHNPAKEAIAWLKVGYLYAFAAIGYQFILRHELDPVREQLRRPSDPVAPGLVRRALQPPGPDGIAFVSSPPEFTSILVLVGRVLIFLPDFSHPSDFYQRMAALPTTRRTLAAKHMPLPREPIFAFDMATSQPPSEP